MNNKLKLGFLFLGVLGNLYGAQKLPDVAPQKDISTAFSLLIKYIEGTIKKELLENDGISRVLFCRDRLVNASLDHDKELQGFLLPCTSWSLFQMQHVQEIKKFIKNDWMLEVGTGAGLLTAFLRHKQLGKASNIVPTDSFTTHGSADFPRYIDDIKIVDAQEAVKQHRQCNVLLMCWPPHSFDMSQRALQEFKGDKVVYIGGSTREDGKDDLLTGNLGFFNELASCWKLVKFMPIDNKRPAMLNAQVQESLYLYERKKPVVSQASSASGEIIDTCTFCNTESTVELKKCSACRVATYCNAVCQKSHWKSGHKKECQHSKK